MPVLSVPNIIAAATGKPYAVRHAMPKQPAGPVRHRGTYQRKPFTVTLDGWQLALASGSFVAVTLAAVLEGIIR